MDKLLQDIFYSYPLIKIFVIGAAAGILNFHINRILEKILFMCFPYWKKNKSNKLSFKFLLLILNLILIFFCAGLFLYFKEDTNILVLIKNYGIIHSITTAIILIIILLIFIIIVFSIFGFIVLLLTIFYIKYPKIKAHILYIIHNICRKNNKDKY